MIVLMLGYFLMGLIFLILRFFYHILPKRNSRNNIIHEIQNDFVILYNYIKQIIITNPKNFRFIVVTMIFLIILPMLSLPPKFEYASEDFLSMMLFLVFVIIFAPKDNPEDKSFPVEIFGFIYSIIFMYYSAGCLIIDIFFTTDLFKENMYIYGYSITVISYVICIATLSRFMERDLSKQEIILLGMIMLTTLEFLTYYGIGFFGGIKWYHYDYDPLTYEISITNIFGDITTTINQGIFIASQSQILERSLNEIWGYIILNGTDVLTVTVVLGYLVQKFMEMRRSG